jgi:hypothetical protein
MCLYELFNVADHVDNCTGVARASIDYSPERALEALRAARTSASRLEMHFDDTIKALEDLVANPDRPDHPGTR